MKILFITMRKILPLNDGAFIYTYGVLRYLHEIGAELTFVSFYDSKDYSEQEKSKLKEICSDVYSVKLWFKNTALNISLKYPNNIRKYTRRNMVKMLKDIKRNVNFDIVIIDHLQMSEYAKLFPDSKIVLIEHNIESNIWFEYARKCGGLKKILVNRSAKKTEQYEKKFVNTVNSVISIADTDARFLKQMSNRKDIVVMHPYNVYDIIKTSDDILNVDRSILFIGSYGWYPNQKAAQYLAEEIMPELRKRVKGIKLYLVGKEPTEEIQKYGKNNEDIIVTGLVDSIDPYIKKCDVFVNAMFEGSGMNIKMIEAMGKGIPIITSIYGSRGINIKSGEEALIFSNTEECIDQIIDIISDRQKAKKLSNNARRFYKKFIQPDNCVKSIFDV